MKHDDDRGAALIAVIALGLVMMILVSTGLTIVSSGRRQTATGQDSSGALDAAYAGVQDYFARVNLNSAYVKYGNSAFKFSKTSAATLTSLGSNPAFGFDGSWATVPGSLGRSSYRYEVDNSAYATSGVLRLKATGRVGQVTRSIVASFRVRGFIDYTYFTDYEIQDPTVSGDPDSCVLHEWEGRADSCSDIQFGKFDKLTGRIHSNDTLKICGADFTGATITTAYTGTPSYSTDGCAAGTATPQTVGRAAELPMPSTNTSMRADARCLYTGPTKVTYTDDGYMTVVSPWTNFTKVDGTPSNPPECGALSDLHSTAGARVKQLDADLLYVQNVPVVATGDPNSWSDTSKPAGVTCLGADAKPTTNGNGAGWSFTTGGTTIGYPLTNEAPASNWDDGAKWSTSTPAYGCRNGDLYVSGKVTTATTAASENYVYITGNVTYGDKSKNILGLVGQNAVLVFNPMKDCGMYYTLRFCTPMLGDPDREIDAALLSVAHTFQVQNWDTYPSRGTLTVFGSIAQKFRGTVARSASNGSVLTGYAKAYTYDDLLKTVSPPKFLAPSAISFTLQQYASVPASFSALGVEQ